MNSLAREWSVLVLIRSGNYGGEKETGEVMIMGFIMKMVRGLVFFIARKVIMRFRLFIEFCERKSIIILSFPFTWKTLKE